MAVMQDIGAIHDAQRLAHIVVGDQHPDTARFQRMDQAANLAHGNRIDTGKGFIQQQKCRVRGQAARDLGPPPFAARQRQRRGAAQMLDREIAQQLLQPLAPLQRVAQRDFQHGHDILFDGQPAKDRHFLRQIADPQTRAAEHRQGGGIGAVNHHLTGIGRHQTGDAIKTGRLARPVRPQQGDDLAPRQRHRHVADHRTIAIGFAQPPDAQAGPVALHLRHQLPPGCRIDRTRPSTWAVPVARLTRILSPRSTLPP